MYVLDTNVVSELRKARSGRIDQHVLAWSASVPVRSLFLSVVTILELEQGVLSVSRRDPTQGQRLGLWLQRDVLEAFSQRILAVDTKVAVRGARLHVPDPRPERDALIAATALIHGMTVVTRNVADFLPTGARTLDPWSRDALDSSKRRS